MKLLEAIEKINQLKSDIDSLDNWIAHLEFNEKPVTGRSWMIVKNAISEVIYDLAEEYHSLKTKVEKATKGIEIENG